MEWSSQRIVSCLMSCLVPALAFAATLLTPAWAHATLLPACEGREQLTRASVDWVVPTILDGVDTCDAGAPAANTHDDDWGDSRVAAMCDERGASVIAPPRILPMTDARMEAGPGCIQDSRAPVVGPSPHGPPALAASPALAEHAVLSAHDLVRPPSSEAAPPFLPVFGGARPGFDRGIDHPPRR